MSTTPFPLGVYLVNPDGSNETAFNSADQQFAALMGAQPQFLDTYIDQNQDFSTWDANASWTAWSAAQSPYSAAMTPVIGLPMTTTAENLSPLQFYQNFASGMYDGMIQGLVQAWAAQGFTNQIWRPGWEMNLSGMPSYATTDPATQAAWVAAFQHIYTVLHAAGTADGVNVQVVWNPSIINYDNVQATTQLYPGNQYVDIIGADVYSDLYPYGSPNAIYDWDKSGQVLNSANPVIDTSLQQWASDPINLMHYYENPASTQWSLDSSGGHALSLQNLIDFAKAQGKPIAIAEAGAGGTSDGAGVADNPTFVQWLSNTLQNAGVPVSFVNVWDSNAGSNYEFSLASDNKPLEAAAWAKYFGAQGAGATSGVTVPAPITIGSGPDTVSLALSEDAWQGDAQVTISVDGTQVGGVQTITVAHSSGQDQIINVNGTWGAGTQMVSVDFLNDAWGGSNATDRNAYVDAASYDGVAATGTLALFTDGSQSLVVGTAMPATVTVGSGADTLALKISEDAWEGNAQFTVSVDGVQVGGTLTAAASHAAGQDQSFLLQGNWGSGSHLVSVDFLNDAWGGNSALDRNLYVDGASYDGAVANGVTLSLLNDGAQSFAVASGSLPTTTIGAGGDTVALKISEDAWQGNAQFTVMVDGVQVGGTQSATASHAAGLDTLLQVEGNWGAGPHSVSVDFLNDAWGGSNATDRNLYVDAASYDGLAASPGTLALFTDGTQTLNVGSAPASVTIGSGADTLDLKISEDAWQGNAQYTVSVDGVQVGGTQNAAASHAAGQDQDLLVQGNWGLGQHVVAVDFLNDAWGGTSSEDRNLYVDGASYDGAVQASGSLALWTSGTKSFTAVSATSYNEGSAGGTVTTLGNDNVVIGSGAVTINADGPSVNVAGGSGAMLFIAGSGNDTIAASAGPSTITGGAGTLTFTMGAGNASITAGSGKEVYDIVAGQAHGALTISNFVVGTDLVHLQGYGATGVSSQTVSGGATSFVLTDGTKITLGAFTTSNTANVFG